MIKTKYGWNCQTQTKGTFQNVCPVGYMEVVPGESISGKITTFFRSFPTKYVQDARNYMDVYVFYVPYRLLWPGWMSFITGQDSPAPGTFPVVTNLWPENFEQRFLISTDAGVTYTQNSAFARYMYWIVYYKFFAIEDNWNIASPTTTAAIQVAANRASTLETRVLPADWTSQTEVVSTAGNQFTVDAFRQAAAADAWEKMRAFYGQRYVDLLAALGVRASWAVLDEPDMLCAHHSDLRYRPVAATTGQTTPAQVLAQTKGYFAGSVTCTLKRKFIPEHGLVGAYAVPRSDGMFVLPPVPPYLRKNAINQFWTPERDALFLETYPSNGFIPTPFNNNWKFPAWEEHRVGMNTHGYTTPTQSTQPALVVDNALDLETVDKYRTIPTNALTGNFDTSNNYHGDLTTTWRLSRRSPIKKPDIRLKIT